VRVRAVLVGGAAACWARAERRRTTRETADRGASDDRVSGRHGS
jgi:hypothetical protein